MSSSDRTRRGGPVRRLAMAVGGVALLTLAACSAQPLYKNTAGAPQVAAALTQISIDEVDNRVAQQVRNKLIFDLGIRSGSLPAYRMKLTVSSAESPLGVTPVESAPAFSVTVTTTYTITNMSDDEVVLRETVRASASYDRVNQQFANERGRRDAENRAADTVANDIRIRLSAAAARGVL